MAKPLPSAARSSGQFRSSIRRWGPRVGIAVVVVAIAAATVHVGRSHPTQRPHTLPAATAIGPGTGIQVTYADGSGHIGCTAGFAVRTKERPGLLVAGHCNRPGGAGTVAIHSGGRYSYPTVGEFSESVFDGNGWNDFDIGLVTLDAGDIPLRFDVDGHAVTGVAEHVEIGDTLCHLGMRSGAPVCGPVVVSEVNKVRFAAPGKCGDSGGPVYVIRGDGTAEAVGVYVAVSDGDSSEPSCEDRHPFSIAQRIQPWLGPWELTLATTPGPA
jgi:hypothetical protein